MYVNVLEQAVASSMERSKGRVGKFNVVIDGDNFSWSKMPSLQHLKTFITILQDHFPDRLGIIVLANLGRVGEILVGIIKPLISEEVRQKIIVLPHDERRRQQVLRTIIGDENIPNWLGGTDSFEFNHDTYYLNDLVISDEAAMEYLETMPYHSS